MTNSATLVNDTELVFPLAANSQYEFEAWIQCAAGGNNSTDCKFAYTVPAGATIRIGIGIRPGATILALRLIFASLND